MFFDRGFTVDQLLSRDPGSNPTKWVTRGQKGHMLALGQKLFIGFFDSGFTVDQLLSRDPGSNPTKGVTRGQRVHMLANGQKRFTVHFGRILMPTHSSTFSSSCLT